MFRILWAVAIILKCCRLYLHLSGYERCFRWGPLVVINGNSDHRPIGCHPSRQNLARTSRQRVYTVYTVPWSVYCFKQNIFRVCRGRVCREVKKVVRVLWYEMEALSLKNLAEVVGGTEPALRLFFSILSGTFLHRHMRWMFRLMFTCPLWSSLINSLLKVIQNDDGFSARKINSAFSAVIAYSLF